MYCPLKQHVVFARVIVYLFLTNPLVKVLDKDFYEFLEYEICKAFSHSPNEDTKGFWCDGVSPPLPNYNYFSASFHDTRQISLKAFIGKDGQSEYELILKLGNRAFNRYLKNVDIRECIPNPDKPNWVIIDIQKRKIEIQLD